MSVHLLHEAVQSVGLQRAVLTAIGVYRGPDPSCWVDGRAWLSCCIVGSGDSALEILPPGEPACWTDGYSYERCCLGSPWKQRSLGSFVPVVGNPESLADDQLRGALACPEGHESFIVFGSLSTFTWRDEFRRMLHPYETAFSTGHAIEYFSDRLTTSVPVELDVSIPVSGRVLHVCKIVLDPEAGAVLFWQEACVAGTADRSASEWAQALVRSWRPLWSSIAMAQLDALHLSLPTWSRLHALTRSAETNLLHMEVLHGGHAQPICSAANDLSSARCDWTRVHPLIWWAVALFLIPGCLHFRRSIQALSQHESQAISILDVWRVIMSILVICAEMKNVDWMQSFELSGVFLAWGLSIRLQGSADNIVARIGRRWSRQFPARIATALVYLFVVRALFTTVYMSHPLLRTSGQSLETHFLDERVSWVLAHYRETELGCLAELFLPPSLWFKIGEYPLKSSTAMWFFRTEATLWFLVLVCRRWGVLGWTVLFSITAAALRSMTSAAYDPQLELLEVPEKTFSFVVCAYISASAWRATCSTRAWFSVASAGLCVVGIGLWLYELLSCRENAAEAAGAPRLWSWMAKCSWMCLLVSGCSGALDCGSMFCTRVLTAMPRLHAALVVLSRLSFGVCLIGWLAVDVFWTGFDPHWHWRRKSTSAIVCYLSALVASAFLHLFVQAPAQAALVRIISSASWRHSKQATCE